MFEGEHGDSLWRCAAGRRPTGWGNLRLRQRWVGARKASLDPPYKLGVERSASVRCSQACFQFREDSLILFEPHPAASSHSRTIPRNGLTQARTNMTAKTPIPI